MKISELIKNILLWPLVAIVLFFSTGLLDDVSWSQLQKTIPFFVILTLFYYLSLRSFLQTLKENEEVTLSDSKKEIELLLKNINLSLQNYKESYEYLKGFIEGRPIPSSRTGHEHLGNPKNSAKIMGAIPKNDSKKRALKFLNNLNNGVFYKMIYLDEGSVKSGIKAYCKEFIKQINENDNFSDIDIVSQFKMILVPPETIQMSFDIFDENDDDITRMLIHFPNIGVLHSDDFNHAWRIDRTEVIRHYVNIFDVIWKNYEDNNEIDILKTAEKDILVLKGE